MIYVLITIFEFRLPAVAILCEWSSHLNDCLNIVANHPRFVKSCFYARMGLTCFYARMGLTASARASFLAWASARSLPSVVK